MSEAEFTCCVICNKPPRLGEALTNEHVIPYALGGDETLPKSVCVRCATKSSQSEAAVLRGAFQAFRTRANLPTRSKRKHESLPIYCVNEDESNILRINIDDYPVILPLPRFGEAAVFSGERLTEPLTPWYFAEESSFEILREKYDVESFATMSLNTLAFAQMIAKIGHIWLTKVLGFGEFEPLLTKFILDRSDRRVINYIGSEDLVSDDARSGEVAHTLSISERNSRHGVLISCDVRLFKNFGSPIYSVIAGRRAKVGARDHWPMVPGKQAGAEVRAMLNIGGNPKEGFQRFRPEASGAFRKVR